ncbi:MAG: divergent polysaccharide deacetylase family protein [Deltaproteobacteria bacterium]|nr:divergent polysaccharide deacetylase family protein [Deltaproteobacteria bacterium]
MAPRRQATRKRRPTRGKRRSAFGPRLGAAAIGVVALAGVAFWLRPRHLPPPSLTPPKMVTSAERVAAAARAKAGASPGAVTAGPAATRQGEAPAPRRVSARIAVVIDDLGDSLETARRVLALEPAVTVAVIPFREASAAVAAAAVSNGREVILHLPLEPERGAAMAGGGGFLRTSMEPQHLESQLERDLRAVPYIVGVNGHMGSRFTSDPRAMRTLLAALRARGLFFLDSKTSPESLAAELAAGLQVPFAERSVFLDHDPSPDAIVRALAVAAKTARQTGQAIAIGHPHASTLTALATWLPAAARDGFAIVPVSALVR